MPPTKAHRFPIKTRNGQIRQMEIFVILLLAGAIFAVVVPLVLNARVQARKMSTQNNLRQLGLAFENYEATFRVLPSGS